MDRRDFSDAQKMGNFSRLFKVYNEFLENYHLKKIVCTYFSEAFSDFVKVEFSKMATLVIVVGKFQRILLVVFESKLSNPISFVVEVTTLSSCSTIG